MPTPKDFDNKMASLTSKMSDANRALLITKTEGNPMEMMSLIWFAKLPTKYFKTICSLDGDDWMAYGSLKEYEYYANRDEGDVPSHKRAYQYEEKDRCELSEDLFNKVIANEELDEPKITYKLYVKMRKADYN